MACLRASPRLSKSLTCYASFLRRYSAKSNDDIESILAKPSWSVQSLIPKNTSEQTTSVTSKQLRHLLRLSALPQPANAEEEQSMLRTLESQIHFVKEMQSVHTTGIEPLSSICDESPDAIKEMTIGLEKLRDALTQEHVSGRRKRIQRIQGEKNNSPDGSTWDGNSLSAASKTKGKYFVVETGSS
ncbi:hypothetical protein N7495_004085 [Penicillium taxi]|uniref:uncharacterized protein n=1 Tax=Penicillium taxi TaxID=168475 RepID=UPI002545076E|nr:uncharacterized protein N7495_004085 [Penicillium taxi]KAJ5899341.1 hypothetical protein N7495_004085 [Penicillium taxi]